VTDSTGAVVYILGGLLIVAILIELPFLVLWLLSLHTGHDRSGTGQRLGIIAMRSNRLPPWGGAGRSHVADYDLAATERSVRSILAPNGGPPRSRLRGPTS